MQHMRGKMKCKPACSVDLRCEQCGESMRGAFETTGAVMECIELWHCWHRSVANGSRWTETQPSAAGRYYFTGDLRRRKRSDTQHYAPMVVAVEREPEMDDAALGIVNDWTEYDRGHGNSRSQWFSLRHWTGRWFGPLVDAAADHGRMLPVPPRKLRKGEMHPDQLTIFDVETAP
jgi:hypothetical protein